MSLKKVEIKKTDKIFIAGHRGLVGSAIVRKLKEYGYSNILTQTRGELDLTNQSKVREFFKSEKPDHVILAAAKVGGIVANSLHQAQFLYENLLIETCVIGAAIEEDVKKLLFIGSTCIYPKHAPQPLREDFLLTGPLETTNEGYAVAKLAAVKLCELINRQSGRCFISALPTNLYGPGDSFHPDHSHVIPGMLRRFHQARLESAPICKVWGTGTPLREFLYVDDLANAVVCVFERYEDPETINLGIGEDVSIRDLASLVQKTVGYRGDIVWDTSKPDGTYRKLLDVSKLKMLGWSAKMPMDQGLAITYEWAVRSGALDTQRRIYV